MGCWAIKRWHMYVPFWGEPGECPCAKCPCSIRGDAHGKVKQIPQKTFPGWETSGLPVSCLLLKSVQACIIYEDLRGLILRHMLVNQNQAFPSWGSWLLLPHKKPAAARFSFLAKAEKAPLLYASPLKSSGGKSETLVLAAFRSWKILSRFRLLFYEKNRCFFNEH